MRGTAKLGDNSLQVCHYKWPLSCYLLFCPKIQQSECVSSLKKPSKTGIYIGKPNNKPGFPTFLALVLENPAWKSSLRSQLRVWLGACWGGCDHRAASVQKNRQDALTAPHHRTNLLPLTPTPALPGGHRGSLSRPSCKVRRWASRCWQMQPLLILSLYPVHWGLNLHIQSC